MSYGDRHTPRALKRPDDDHVEITWGDGATSRLPMNLLRARCPCASCINEWTGEVMVKPEDVEDVRVKAMKQMGTYAFSITFSDGHDTGIFTWKKLRELGDELEQGEGQRP